MVGDTACGIYALSPSYSSPSLSTLTSHFLDSEPPPRTRSSDKLTLDRPKSAESGLSSPSPYEVDSRRSALVSSAGLMQDTTLISSRVAVNQQSRSPTSNAVSQKPTSSHSAKRDDARRVSDEIQGVLSVFGIVPIKVNQSYFLLMLTCYIALLLIGALLFQRLAETTNT